MNENTIITMNCCHGKNKGTVFDRIKVSCNVIVQPTNIPIIIPVEQLASTKTIASQKYNNLIRILVNPIDLRTAISFVCSYRLADIFAESAKKHKNIVMTIIVLNALFMILTILSVVLTELSFVGSQLLLCVK